MKLSQLSLADYNQLDSIPVINQDLSASGFTPVANTYYRHTGATTDTFTQGVIYLYDTAYHKLGESGGSVQTYACANAAELQDAILSTILPASQQGKKIYLRILSGSYNGACFPLSVIDETRYSRVYISGTWSNVGWSGGSTASHAAVTRYTFVAISLSDCLPVVFTDGVSLEGKYETPGRYNCDAQTEIIIS